MSGITKYTKLIQDRFKLVCGVYQEADMIACAISRAHIARMDAAHPVY